MKIRVLTFGIARDITGAGTLDVQLPEGATIDTAHQYFREKYPALNRLSSLLIALNAEYASSETVLRENDEIALIPPVSGG